MKRVLIPTILLALSGCATKTPWRGTASIKESRQPIFEDVSSTANIRPEPASAIAVGDFDNDGLVDFVTQDKLYRNVSTKDQISFEDVTHEVNLHFLKGLPLFMDVNNDGQLDIITTKGQLHLQNNKQFLEVSERYGLKIADDAFTISFGDLNNDGWPDLLVGRREIYEKDVFSFVPPQVFINREGKTFEEISDQQEMQKFPAYVRGIAWADFNNDQNPDIYYSNYRLRQNFLFQMHNGKMVDAASKYGVQGEYDTQRYFDPHLKKNFGPLYGHTIGSVWSDLDNDGNLDLFVSNLVHKFVGMNNKGTYDYRGYVCDDSKVYKNLGAPNYTFQDVRKDSELPVRPIVGYPQYKGDELWAHATAADFDNDGFQDMYVSQVYNLHYAYSLLFKNKGDFKFANVTESGPKVYDSYAGAWADFNNDGKMDLIVSGREAVDVAPRLRIFKNVYQSENNYLKLRLIGSKSGKIPVTTQVRVYHGNGLFMKQVEGVTGTFNQQNDPVLHFGLGDVKDIKHIEISWSSGRKQILKNIKVNSTRTVVEGEE